MKEQRVARNNFWLELANMESFEYSFLLLSTECTKVEPWIVHQMEAFADVDRKSEAFVQSSETAAKAVRNKCTPSCSNEQVEAFPDVNRKIESSAQSS